MLAEITLTPQVFDEDLQPDPEGWSNQLKCLAQRVQPHYGLQPLIFGDLYDGSLLKELVKLVGNMARDEKREDGNRRHVARTTAQQILTVLKRCAVERGACGEWPFDEDAWIDEARASHEMMPLDLVLATAASCKDRMGAFPPLIPVSQAEQCPALSDVQATCSPPMKIEQQADLLRPFCRRFSYLALVNPYLASNEFNFCEMVTRLAGVERGDRGVTLDLHLWRDPNASVPEQVAQGLQHRLNKVAGQLRIRAVFWENLLDRYVLVGTTVSSGKGKVFKPIKGISLGHVARGGDDGCEPTAWHLLTDRETGDRYRFRYEGKPVCDPIVLFEGR